MKQCRAAIALLRHADYRQPVNVPSALLPYPLTDTGKQQAQEGAKLIEDFSEQKGLALSNILDASRLLRAWQTADIIGHDLFKGKHQIQEFDALAERSVGAMANLTLTQIEDIIRNDPRLCPPPENWKAQSEYTLPFQGAESLLDAGKRVACHLESAWQAINPTGGIKIIVGHGASIRHAAYHLGLLKYKELPLLSMHHARPIFLSKDTTSWKIIAGEWKIRKTADESDELISN